ncbi:MAG: hypothetical protein WEA82_06710 [Idiomarina sp.]
MSEQHFNKLRIYFMCLVVLLVLAQLLWEHLHGGVVTHHFMASADYPGFSNWWAIVILPALAWFASSRVKKRIAFQSDAATTGAIPKSVLIGFFGVLGLAILQSLGFEFGYENISMYAILSLLLISLFLPVYRAECILAHVLGSTFTFGPIIPLIVISIIALISAFSNFLVGPLVVKGWRWFKSAK